MDGWRMGWRISSMSHETAAKALAKQLAQAVTESVGVRFNFDRDDVALLTTALAAAYRQGMQDQAQAVARGEEP